MGFPDEGRPTGWTAPSRLIQTFIGIEPRTPCNEIPAKWTRAGKALRGRLALRYLCLYCGLRHHSYFGNLADLFQGLGLYSLLMIFLVSRFWLIGKWVRPSGV